MMATICAWEWSCTCGECNSIRPESCSERLEWHQESVRPDLARLLSHALVESGFSPERIFLLPRIINLLNTQIGPPPLLEWEEWMSLSFHSILFMAGTQTRWRIRLFWNPWATCSRCPNCPLSLLLTGMRLQLSFRRHFSWLTLAGRSKCPPM